MFREMRRKKQALSPESCTAILDRAASGVLALDGDDGYPYALPISYVWHNGKLYFHSASKGHKLDAIRRNPKASFCVIDQDRPVPEEFTTYFRSVIVFGTIRILEEDQEKYEAIRILADKYSPDEPEENREKEIRRFWKNLCMLELTPAHISGKEAKELS